jgi:hypothetical protein
MHQKEAGSCHSHKNNKDYLHPVTRPFPPLPPSCLDCVWREGEKLLHIACHMCRKSAIISPFLPPIPLPRSPELSLQQPAQGRHVCIQCFGSGSSHLGWIRIRIQPFRLNPDPNPGFWWPKIGKNCSCKKMWYYFDQKLQFTYPKASVRDIQAIGETFSPQKRTSSNYFLWVIFALLDADPDSESGYTDPIESGSSPYPDPKISVSRESCCKF